jgi:hypothetical protein
MGVFFFLPWPSAGWILAALFVSSLLALPFSDALIDSELWLRTKRCFANDAALLGRLNSMLKGIDEQTSAHR